VTVTNTPNLSASQRVRAEHTGFLHGNEKRENAEHSKVKKTRGRGAKKVEDLCPCRHMY